MRRCKYCGIELPFKGEGFLKDRCTKCYDKLYRQLNLKRRIKTKKYQSDFKSRNPDYWNDYSKSYKEERKLIKKVIASTNNRFVKDKLCNLCHSKKSLQFHHWRYRMPVQRQDFCTLCRICHTLIHYKPIKSRLFHSQQEQNSIDVKASPIASDGEITSKDRLVSQGKVQPCKKAPTNLRDIPADTHNKSRLKSGEKGE